MALSIREKIVEFITSTDFNRLPQEVIHQSKRCLLDFLGVAFGCGKSELNSYACDLVFKMGGEQAATVIGEDFKVPALNAAYLCRTDQSSGAGWVQIPRPEFDF